MLPSNCHQCGSSKLIKVLSRHRHWSPRHRRGALGDILNLTAPQPNGPGPWREGEPRRVALARGPVNRGSPDSKSKGSGKEKGPQTNRTQPGPGSCLSSPVHPARIPSASFQEHPFPFFLQLRCTFSRKPSQCRQYRDHGGGVSQTLCYIHLSVGHSGYLTHPRPLPRAGLPFPSRLGTW